MLGLSRPSGFGLNIQRQLEKRGIPVTPQYGLAGHRLDFACAHPHQSVTLVTVTVTSRFLSRPCSSRATTVTWYTLSLFESAGSS